MKRIDKVGRLEKALYRLIDRAKDIEAKARAVTDQLFPPGSRVEVSLKHGQKKLSRGTVVARNFSDPGYVCIVLDNAKPRSRQRFRDVYHTQVRPLVE